MIGKYLIPRRKQLSLALIASLSVSVIAMVVWLVVVFLSITEGMTQNWLEKLTSLNAPIRITPTREYFSSYYYLSDSWASSSNFTSKSIGEKAMAERSDPYSPDVDAALPDFWPESDGKDPVKIAYQILGTEKDLSFQDFEVSGGSLKLTLENNGSVSQLTQVSYLSTFCDKSPVIDKIIVQPALKHKIALNLGREQGLLLSKNYRDSGVKMGDRGTISYMSQTFSTMSEQKVPVYVAGFYDPGIMPIGNKYILANPSLIRTMNASSPVEHFEKTLSNGIWVWFQDLDKAAEVKVRLQKSFDAAGIGSYWTITTFREYDFAKDLMQQFQSDKNLFTMIGTIILVVACCNIISLLIILVGDKKKEIAILQAMGARPKSIALIFGGCGMVIGFLSSLVGVAFALLTLHNLDSVVGMISKVQGHDAFNAAFYGASLPNGVSQTAILYVLITTPILSLVAGLIPAWRATRLKPSEILRSE
jgi:lipoprotein-releasing system permease protein